MARAGYCHHGTYIGTKTAFVIDGEEIAFKNNCFLCDSEEQRRKEKLEAVKQHEKYLVKENFLLLLKEDEEFKNEVKTLLGL